MLKAVARPKTMEEKWEQMGYQPFVFQSLDPDNNIKKIHVGLGRSKEDLLLIGSFMCGFWALLFGLFTACMMLDQWTVVATNDTYIDRIDGARRADGAAAGGEGGSDAHEKSARDVDEVFGGTATSVQRCVPKPCRGCRAGWLLPTPARFPASAREQLYGFRLPPAPGGAAAGADLV